MPCACDFLTVLEASKMIAELDFTVTCMLSGPKSLCTSVIGFPSANVYSDRNVLLSLEGLNSYMVTRSLSALVL